MRTVEDACPYGILPNIYNTGVSDSHKYSIYVNFLHGREGACSSRIIIYADEDSRGRLSVRNRGEPGNKKPSPRGEGGAYATDEGLLHIKNKC